MHRLFLREGHLSIYEPPLSSVNSCAIKKVTFDVKKIVCLCTGLDVGQLLHSR